MDAAGYLNTRIVSADTGWEPVVGDMTTDSAYAAAVDVVGAHYPGAPPAAAYKLNKTLFASEMWNLGCVAHPHPTGVRAALLHTRQRTPPSPPPSHTPTPHPAPSYVDDWPGALKLASDLSDHASWGLSASILWCLIYSWYAPLPFSRVIPGTQAGAGHSILTAGEPWSGNYQLNPTIHAMAHHTQFAEPGWVHLPVDAPGLGPLPGGGALVTRFNPRTPAGVLEFSIVAHTAGATESQDVVFTLPAGTPRPPAALNVWFTNETMAFARAAPVADGGGGAYAITLAPNSLYTLTTRDGGGGPAPVNPIPPSAPFPFPYADAFEGYAAGAYAKYFCDEGGAFVVAPVPAGFSRADGAAAGGNAYFQVVTKVPIVWEKNPDPYTLIGDFNAGSKWSDYTVSVDVAVGPSAAPPPEPPPGPVEAAVTAPCAPSGVGQAFTLSTGGGWPAQLRAVGAPGQCLGITGSGDLYPGAEDVGLQACASAPAWAFDASTRQLREMGADRCLDVLSANTSAGARVIAFSCKPAPVDANQRWALANVSAAQGAVALQSALRAPPLCVGFAQLPPAPAGAAPYVFVAMRIGKYERNGPPPSGYTLKVALSANATAGGAWALQFAGATLAQGVTKAPVLPGVFHTAAVGGKGPTVTASWDGDVLAQISDSKSAYGMAAVGSGWHEAFFDNFKVE
jgi:hypothetical protein